MTAQQAIHEHWSVYRPLTILVPADRIYTGLPPLSDETGAPIQFPYVSLTLEGEVAVGRTSSGLLLATERVRFSIFDSSYDRARRIEAAITRYFNGRDFAWSGGAVLDMKPDNRIETENEDDGVWQIARDFLVRITNTTQRVLA